MRVLVLTSYVPYPANTGARVHVSGQLRYLSQEHEVTLMCPVRPNSAQAEHARRLADEYPVKVKAIPWQKRSRIRFLPHLFRYVRGKEPIGNLIFYLEELADLQIALDRLHDTTDSIISIDDLRKKLAGVTFDVIDTKERDDA